MKSEILCVGTEILLGDIVNTNSQFISKELANLGIEVYHQSVVGDNPERLLDEFKIGFERSDIIIIFLQQFIYRVFSFVVYVTSYIVFYDFILQFTGQFILTYFFYEGIYIGKIGFQFAAFPFIQICI